MELIALALTWPILLLIAGFVMIAVTDIPGVGSFFLFPLVIIIAIIVASQKKSRTPLSPQAGLERMRRTVVTFSIAGLLPIFVRYLVRATDHSLVVVLFGLAIGFGLVLWGMFMKGQRVLMHANVLGGALVLAYVYTELWSLGEGARIVAAAAGLAAAIIVSVVKLREKLT